MQYAVADDRGDAVSTARGPEWGVQSSFQGQCRVVGDCEAPRHIYV